MWRVKEKEKRLQLDPWTQDQGVFFMAEGEFALNAKEELSGHIKLLLLLMDKPKPRKRPLSIHGAFCSKE